MNRIHRILTIRGLLKWPFADRMGWEVSLGFHKGRDRVGYSNILKLGAVFAGALLYNAGVEIKAARDVCNNTTRLD